MLTESHNENKHAYEPLEIGLEMNVFIKDNRTGQPIVGGLWPGDVYFPDFVTHPNVSAWWQRCIERFHRTVAFDGLWIDENEPTSFIEGQTWADMGVGDILGHPGTITMITVVVIVVMIV